MNVPQTRAPPDAAAGFASIRRAGILGIPPVIVGCSAAVAAAVAKDVSAADRVVVAVFGGASLYLGLQALGRAAFGTRFNFSLWVSGTWLAIVVGAAVVADALPLSESKSVSRTLGTEAFLRPDLLSAHPFGTDGQGLDILGGVIYGARVSLVVGGGAVMIGMLIGGSFGVAAGYHRGKLESVVSVLTDSMLAFPPLILLLATAAVFQPTVQNLTVVLGILGIPVFMRVAHVNTVAFNARDFVLASRAIGATNRRIIVRELLPNVMRPVMSLSFVMVAVLIVAEASLSFLGVSIRRPNPTWGNMIAAGRDDYARNPHLVFVPGVVMFLTVLALNRLGEHARARWDGDRSA